MTTDALKARHTELAEQHRFARECHAQLVADGDVDAAMAIFSLACDLFDEASAVFARMMEGQQA